MNDDLTPILGTEADEEILVDVDLANPPKGLEVSGLGGNDTIDGTPGDGNNVLKGGPGDDELFPNTNDQLFGEEDDDILDATAGQGNNHLDGGPGVDTLYGGTNDKLLGGSDNDIIFLGQGNNTATGGRGNDFFVAIDGERPNAPNVITDFNPESEVLGFGTGPTQLSDLEITAETDGTEINFDGQLIVTLLGVTDPLDVNNFLFGFTEFPVLPEEADEVRLDTPTLSIAEGNSGDSPATIFSFDLSRSGSTLDELILEFAVTGDGATPANGADFVGSTLPNGQITFAAGDLTQTVEIEVFGDIDFEPDEDFLLTISNPSDANTVLVDDGGNTVSELQSQGTIINDDPIPAIFEVDILPSVPSSIIEGNTGTTTFTFGLTRSGSAEDLINPLTIDFEVVGSGDNPAIADDFLEGIGSIQTATEGGTIGETNVALTLELPDQSVGTEVQLSGSLASSQPVNQFNIIYLVDVSNSTADTQFEGDNPVGDLNNDGLSNTVLDAIIASYENLSQEIIRQGFPRESSRVTLIPFSSVAQAPQTFIVDQDSNGDGTTDLSEALRSLTASGDTDFSTGLEAVNGFLGINDNDPDNDLVGTNLVALFSDGIATAGSIDGPLGTLGSSDTNIRALGIGTSSLLTDLTTIDEADGVADVTAEQLLNPSGASERVFNPTGTESFFDTVPISSPETVDRIDILLNDGVVDSIGSDQFERTIFGLDFLTILGGLNPDADDSIRIQAFDSDGNLIADPFQTVENTAELPSGTFTFAPGQTEGEISIEVLSELIPESDEDFSVELSSDTPNVAFINSSASATILDDDAAEISISPPLIEQAEGNGSNSSFTYTVTRTGNGLQPLSINFDVFASGANPADADDFVNGIITTQTQTVAATLSDGTAVELSNTIPAGVNGNRSSGTGLIGLPGGETQQFNVAYVIDVSGSTTATFEGDVQVPDINGDGEANTLLDGEILGFLNLNQSINDSGLASTVNVGLIPFDDNVIPAGSGDNNEVFVAFADQDDDVDRGFGNNGIPDVEDALIGLTSAGATNFEEALLAAEDFFNNSAEGNNLVFFVSDGEANDGDFTDVSARLRAPDGINAQITAIGLGTGSSLEQLDLLDDGLANDSAQQVTNPDDLTSELLDPPITATDIERIEVIVDGNLVSVVPQSELVTSPLGVSYDLPLNDLTIGEDDEITIRVISSDGSESVIAETTQLLGANENALVSGDVTFAAGEFTKEVTIEVVGDLDFEADENFSIVISNPSLPETRFVDEAGNEIDELSSDGLIINDDQVPLPPIVEDASLVIAESRSNGSVLGTIQASDPDSSEPVFFTILSGNIDLDGDGVNAFSIDAQSGALSVLDSDDLDADRVGQVQLTIRAIDVDGQTGTGIADIQILADQDGDGSPDEIERIAGDRNLDGQPDFIQPDVTSVPAANAPANFDSRNFLTFDTSTGRFTDVQVLREPAETGVLLPGVKNFVTREGFNSFVLRDLDPEENATNINLILPAGSTTNSYFVLNEQNQAYEGFVYNGEDGARAYDLGLSGDSSRQLLLRYVDGGRADRDGQVNGEIQQSGVSATSNEVLDLQANNGILSIGGSPGQIATIDFEVQGRSGSPTTYGVFQVDDAQGTIGELAPGDDGYLAAALSKAQVIAETIPGQSTLSGRATRTIQVGAGQQLGFFSIADNLSFADIIAAEAAGGPLVPGVIDSDLNDLNISVPGANPNGGVVGVSTNGDNLSLDFGRVDLVAEINDDPLGLNQFIGNLQSDENGELFDLRNLAGQRFNANFTVNREAVNTNTVGFYEILDESGAVRDQLTGQVINPGDNGYVAAAIANRVEGLALRIDDNGTRTQSAVIEGGSLLAPYIVVEGGATDINNNLGIFFAFGAANRGNFDQIKLLGDNIFGFEDVAFGGDQDYNDIIVRTNFSVIA